MHLLDLFFPKRCVSCRRIGSYICSQCQATIIFCIHPVCPMCMRPAIGGMTHPRCRKPWGIDGMYALARYQGTMRSAIHVLKYKYVSDIVQTLALLLTAQYPVSMPPIDILIPVPLHPKREKWRGFNQSALLARHIGAIRHVPINSRMLMRVRMTTPQIELDKQKRKANLRGAFTFHAGDVKGKVVGIVDDVSTTGTTLAECAKVLKQKGAKAVWGIVLAHG